jgi:hypothetical protein
VIVIIEILWIEGWNKKKIKRIDVVGGGIGGK